MTTLQGILNLDKPPGISSAAAVARVKHLLPRGTKIGHAGTLDKFATGVLLLLIGRATKLCESLMDQPKQYEATLKFGATTETDDPDSPEIPWPNPVAPDTITFDQIQQTLPNFIGEIRQRPPAYSALKIGGRRASDRQRSGQKIQLEPRPVKIYAIQIIDYHWPLLRLRIDCGRGTYIRSLARDLGAELIIGGHLTQLRRTRVGSFDVNSGVQLDSLNSQNVEANLVNP